MGNVPDRKNWTSLRKGGARPVESPSVEEVAQTPESSGPPAVLVVNQFASTYRLIRESLENFTNARVQTSPNSLHAFEKALQNEYKLFIFGLHMPDLDGPVLYELISTAYVYGGRKRKIPPAVLFVREKDDPRPPDELSRDARVKAILMKPIRIERLLQSVEGVLEREDPLGTADS